MNPPTPQVRPSRDRSTTLVIIGAAATALGLLVFIAFLIAAGVDYRITEDQGLEPGPTPPGIALGMTTGLGVFVLGLALFGAAGIWKIRGLARKVEPTR